MPAPTIDDAFIQKFNRDVHLEFQQRGSLFRTLVRTDAEVMASTLRFQKLGTITVGSKARNGTIPISNPGHTHVDVTMLDRYAATLIDKLDLTKLNIDVRSGYVENMTAGFARETDDQIVAAFVAGATQTQGSFSGGITRNVALLSREQLDVNNVFSDGRCYCAVTPRQWSYLMTIDQFTREEYIGYDQLPWKQQGFQMKLWNRVYWFVSTRLPGTGTSQAKCYMWHKTAVGHGINAEVDITWDWENLMKGWSGAGSMSMNGVVIDARGIVEIRIDDTVTLP
jgi:hypothetical protein